MFRTFGRFAAGIMAAFVGIIIVTFAIADDLNNPPTSGLTVESDPIFTASSNLFYRSSNPSNYVTASVTNGLLTSYSETDPAFVSASNLFLQVEADTVALQTGAVLQTQIDELANTTWQDAVIDVDLATPPVSPTTGDRYVVATGGTGAWATKDKNIAQYNGSGWDFTAPVLGMGVNETDSGNDYRYNGSVWTLLTGPAPAKSVSVQESDGSPAIAGATKIVVPNGSLTKSGTTATFNWLTSAVTSAVSTNLAAGIPTVVGSELRIGTNINVVSFGTNNIVWNELPTGSNNGVNTNFYTASNIIGGNWLKVYRNGLVMDRTSDFVYVASNHFRFVPAAYASNDVIRVDYIK